METLMRPIRAMVIAGVALLVSTLPAAAQERWSDVVRLARGTDVTLLVDGRPTLVRGAVLTADGDALTVLDGSLLPPHALETLVAFALQYPDSVARPNSTVA